MWPEHLTLWCFTKVCVEPQSSAEKVSPQGFSAVEDRS